MRTSTPVTCASSPRTTSREVEALRIALDGEGFSDIDLTDELVVGGATTLRGSSE